jgi:hypothetical protein
MRDQKKIASLVWMRQFNYFWTKSRRHLRHSVCIFALLGLVGCGNGDYLAGSITSDNSAVVTRSTVGTVHAMSGQTRTLSLTFTSTDALSLTDFVITTNLAALPPGWSAPNAFACALVASGSSCVLNLTYAPTAMASSAFDIEFAYVNYAGQRRTGRETIVYDATVDNNVVATASPSGQINAVVGTGSQPVTVTFTTEDGSPASDLQLQTRLGSLPAGWSATVQEFGCVTVGAGNGCLLPLTFTPAAKGSGTLRLEYSYASNAGVPKSGAIDLSYSATAHNNVISTVAPSGQVTAVVGSTRPVMIAFASDDGDPITEFAVTSDLSQLPTAWSGPASGFSCATISAAHACELALSFAPTVVGSGALRLNYQYRDGSGALKTSSLDIDYSGTTYNNVVTTVAPSAPIAAVAGSAGQSVAVTFGTDDGNVARSLQLTSDLSALPLGWSSPATSFSCETVNAGVACSLPLTYAPTVVAAGDLLLTYSYMDNAGTAKTGSAIIGYASTAQNAITAQANPVTVAAELGQTRSISVAFVADDDVVTDLSVTSNLLSLPAGWTSDSGTFSCAAVTTASGCELDLSYAPIAGASGTLALNYRYTSNAGVVRTATLNIPYSGIARTLYVTNHDAGADYILMCGVRADGSLAPCQQTHSRAYDITQEMINLSDADYRGGRLVLAQTSRSNGIPTVWNPTLYSNGTIDWMYGAGSPVTYPRAIVLNPAVTHAYVFGSAAGLGLCRLGATAGFHSCNLISTPHDYERIAFSTDGAVAYGAHAPPGFGWSIDMCSVAADATLSSCTEVHVGDASKVFEVIGNRLYAQNNFGGLDVCAVNGDHTLGTCVRTAPSETFMDVAFTATNAYLTQFDATLRRCPLNADGTLGSCVTLNDPNFLATTGIALR